MKFLLLFFFGLIMIPAANAQENKLSCENPSVECVEELTARAVENSGEIKLLDATIKLAKRKGWTQYIDVSAIDPLTMGIQVVRNLLGGGTRQERKIKIKSLELAQVEKVSVLRSGISSLLFSLDSIKTRRDAARIAEAAHVKRVTLYETTYKFGDGSTETMLNLWSAADSFKQTIGQFEIEAVELRRKLIEIVSPAQIERSQM